MPRDCRADRTGRARAVAAAIVLGAALCACRQVDVIARPLTGGSGGGRDAGGAGAAGASLPDAGRDQDASPGPVDAGEDATLPPGPEPCPYRQAPAVAGGSVADVVAFALSRAVCACTSYSGSAELVTDAVAPAAPGSAGIGVNEAFDQQQRADVAGALIVAGDDGISVGAGATLAVTGELASGGPLEGGEARVEVGGDAQVAGRIDLQELAVTGTLTQPSGETLQVAGGAMLGGVRQQPVQVAAPCACDPAVLLDVATLVRDAAQRVPELPSDAPLGERCAEYALDGGSVDVLELAVFESAALYVTGDLHLSALRVLTATDAELDLFVEGNLAVTGPLELGSSGGGSRVRLHVGGTGTIDLSEGGVLHGALYAPGSELVLSGALEATGALFVRRVAASAAVTVHYDPRAVEPP